ncbi:MAG: DUF5715 family protein [Bacteroidaceae bacterium]|nr:DUF5715 family protein [Bacteroidaceae bacterium]
MSEIQKKSKHSKKKFIIVFLAVTIMFSAIRHLFSIEVSNNLSSINDEEIYDPSEEEYAEIEDSVSISKTANADLLSFASDDPYGRPHAIYGVWSYDKCFPDINSVQIVAAKQNGIQPPANREAVLKLVKEHKLVDINNSPFYIVDNLSHSMPYLVPKAQHLLNTICLNFIDSLQMKGIEPHLPMVTSVLRTVDDVKKLQKGNGNATTNSCHCYGTTVDISYNRFVPIKGTYSLSIPHTKWDERLKQVLSEVLNDLRKQDKCYVKYEVKQGCYHLTVR